MKTYQPRQKQKLAFVMSLIFALATPFAVSAAPLHEASGNIVGTAKDKNVDGKKNDDNKKATKSEDKTVSSAPKKAGLKTQRESALEAPIVQAAYRVGHQGLTAFSAQSHKTGGRLAASKRTEILGKTKKSHIMPRFSGNQNYPQAEIISYHPAASGLTRPYEGLIHKLALKYNMPEDFIHAVVHTESNYNPALRGGVGEIGLMQLRPATARLMGYKGTDRGLYNPEVNLEYGVRYLAQARASGDGSLCGTVLKYNAGHGATHMNPISFRYCQKVKSYLHSVGYRY